MGALVRRSAIPALVVMTILAILFYFIFPSQTYLGQRSTEADARGQLAEIEAENAELQAQIVLLNTAAEVERLARRDFNLVYPGEVPYAVLPPPPEAVHLPNTWPFNVVRDRLER